MTTDSHDGQSPAALRPLRAVRPTMDRLRSGAVPADALPGSIREASAAVERSLRLLLRDDPRAPLQIRLRSLAPEELRADEVLAELRQLDRLSLPLAASVHELFDARRRVHREGTATPQDAGLALRVFERLEFEVSRSPVPAPVSETAGPAPHEPTRAPATPDLADVEDDPDLTARADRAPFTRARALLAGAAVLVLLLVAGGLWMTNRSDTRELDRGIALFRSGAYPDAAAHFFRYAQANPTDATPRIYLARIHRRMGRLNLAVDELRVALDIDQNDAGVHQELGFVLLESGQPEPAIERFRSAIALDRDAAQGWIGLVRALREAGRGEEADRTVAEAPPQVREMLERPAAGTGQSPP